MMYFILQTALAADWSSKNGWTAFVTFPEHVIKYLSPSPAFWHNEIISSLLMTRHYSCSRHAAAPKVKQCPPSIVVYRSRPSAMMHISHSHIKLDIFSMLNMFLLNNNSWTSVSTCSWRIYLFSGSVIFLHSTTDSESEEQISLLCSIGPCTSSKLSPC